MKLSEAMRKGEGMVNRCEVHLVMQNDQGGVCACALGQAYLGAGGKLEDLLEQQYVALETMFPQLITEYVDAEDSIDTIHLETAIWGKNDNAHWTPAQIANWLESMGY